MKNIKWFLILLLTLALFATAAAAEELPYLQQLSQNAYINAVLIDPACYPEVCIAPYYFSSMYLSNYSEPAFMKFPCPAGTFAASFDENSVVFLDLTYNRQYIYNGRDGYAYENFLNRCEDESNILADGSDGVAIYIEPSSQRANALIGVPEISRQAKLQVTLIDDSLRKKTDEEIAASLTEQIQAEVARIQASLTVETMPEYWTAGRFAGFKVISEDRGVVGLSLTFTLPEGYEIIKVDNTDVTIAKVLGERNGLEIAFDLETYSYVNSKQEENPDSVTTVTIGDADYRVYPNWYNDEKILSAYVDRALSNTAGYSGEDTYYLTIYLDPDGDCEWATMDDLVEELTEIINGVVIEEGQSKADYRESAPYAAAE